MCDQENEVGGYSPNVGQAQALTGESQPDFRRMLINRIGDLKQQQADVQIVLDALPSKISPELNRAMINTFLRH